MPSPSKSAGTGRLNPAGPNCTVRLVPREPPMNQVAVARSKVTRSVMPSPSKSPCTGMWSRPPKSRTCGPRVERATDHWPAVGAPAVPRW